VSYVATVERVAQLHALAARLATHGTAGAGDFGAKLTSALARSDLASEATRAGSDADVPYADLIDRAAARYGIDRNVLRGLIRAESGFNARATSPAGAAGLTQLMPATARSLGVTNPYDPAQAIEGGAKYLRQQLDAFGGDYRLALAAYNAGPAAVRRYGGVPPYPETQAYVQRVLAYASEFARGGSAR